jgi:hypothetical protein
MSRIRIVQFVALPTELYQSPVINIAGCYCDKLNYMRDHISVQIKSVPNSYRRNSVPYIFQTVNCRCVVNDVLRKEI